MGLFFIWAVIVAVAILITITWLFRNTKAQWRNP